MVDIAEVIFERAKAKGETATQKLNDVCQKLNSIDYLLDSLKRLDQELRDTAKQRSDFAKVFYESIHSSKSPLSNNAKKRLIQIAAENGVDVSKATIEKAKLPPPAPLPDSIKQALQSHQQNAKPH